MTRIRATLALFLAISLVSAISAFGQTPAAAVKVAQLQRTPFEVNGLTIVVQKLNGRVNFAGDARDVGVALAAVRLETRPITS